MGKYCSNCGAELKENADVCIKCGVSVRQKATVNFDPNAKSRIVAGILGILLGALGVHNFYLGNNGKATAQLLISVLSLGILSFVSAIWGLIEGVQILTGTINEDANGYPLSN